MGGDTVGRLLQLPVQEVRAPWVVPGPEEERKGQERAQDGVWPAGSSVPPQTSLPHRLVMFLCTSLHIFLYSVSRI